MSDVILKSQAIKDQLLQRFSHENATISSAGVASIDIPCILCERHMSLVGCILTEYCSDDCPLAKFKTGEDEGCITYLEDRIPSLLERVMLGSKSIYWHDPEDERVRENLDKVKNLIKTWQVEGE